MKKKNEIKKNEIVKKANPVKLSIWPFAAFALVLLIFLLHSSVFDSFDSILQAPNKEEFSSLLFKRNLKTASLIICTAILLVLAIKKIPFRLLRIASSFFLWIFLFFYVGELWLCMSPPSQGNNEAYVARIWFKKYWRVNSFGFRDKDFNIDALKFSRNTIIFLGDSYVAGHGIKKTEDRTSDVLQKKLGDQYNILNIGKNGFGTQQEYRLLKGYPGKAKMVILSHVANDIEEILPADESFASIYQTIKTPVSDFLYKHSRNSVLLDAIYHFVKLMEFGKQMDKNTKSGQPKNTVIYDWYKNDSLFRQHLQDVQLIANYVRDTLNAKFILITYPENSDVDSCDRYIHKKLQQNLVNDGNHRVLNLSPLFKDYSASKRRVNILDNHPSVLINKIVADSLYNILNKPF